MKRVYSAIRRSPAPVRILIFLAGVLVLAAPIALLLYRFEDRATGGKSIVATPIWLFLVFLLALPRWMQIIHSQPYPWRPLGMMGGKRWWLGWAIAFALGAGGVTLLYVLQLLLGWGSWVSPSGQEALYNLLAGGVVGVGVGLAEELVFRGWLLFELEQDYTSPLALGMNAILFAIAHYFRPLSAIVATWPQFAGLVLLGVTLVWARRIPLRDRGQRFSTLGFAAGLHGGLVWAYYQVDVNDLILTNDRIPDWVTGIGGNPLAGLLGLTLLGGIAAIAYWASHPPVPAQRVIR